MSSEALLEVVGASKTFSDLCALDDLSLTVHSGEILAVVGQNGSGKSTLVKLLAGVQAPDQGFQMTLAEIGGHQSGLYFIHQDLGLVDGLSTVENLDLGRRRRAATMLRPHKRGEIRRAIDMIAGFGGDFDVTKPIGELTPAERTIVAIARALDGWDHPDNVVVLDEPTASLYGNEVDKLLSATRRLAERGAGVIFVSHRLDEVIELADRVICLRDGKLVAEVERGTYDYDSLAELIAGRMIVDAAKSTSVAPDNVVLRVRGLSGATVERVDLELRAGEIVGVSGVNGSGREAIAGLLAGARKGYVDTLEVMGQGLGQPDLKSARKAGVAYVPSDRHADGAVMTMSVRENISLPMMAPLRRAFGLLNKGAEGREVNNWLDRFDVRPRESERPLELFSGGNQQKVVLAKWLRTKPKVLLLDEPTQGVDVGAKADIYALLISAAAEGAALLVCSSDAKELTILCNRVMVMRDGVVVAEMSGTELSEAGLTRAALSEPSPTRPNITPLADSRGLHSHA